MKNLLDTTPMMEKFTTIILLAEKPKVFFGNSVNEFKNVSVIVSVSGSGV